MTLPNPYAEREKTGYKKMLDLAKTLCRLVQQFEVIIRARFGDNIAIIALLESIKALCELLPEADAAFQAETLVITPPSETSEDTAGYDPSAPPAADPDLT